MHLEEIEKRLATLADEISQLRSLLGETHRNLDVRLKRIEEAVTILRALQPR